MVGINPMPSFGERISRLDKEGTAAHFIGGAPGCVNGAGVAPEPCLRCRYTDTGRDCGVGVVRRFRDRHGQCDS